MEPYFFDFSLRAVLGFKSKGHKIDPKISFFEYYEK